MQILARQNALVSMLLSFSMMCLLKIHDRLSML